MQKDRGEQRVKGEGNIRREQSCEGNTNCRVEERASSLCGGCAQEVVLSEVVRCSKRIVRRLDPRPCRRGSLRPLECHSNARLEVEPSVVAAFSCGAH